MRKPLKGRASIKVAGPRAESAPVLPSARGLFPVEQGMDATLHLSAIVESSDDAIVSKSLEGSIVTWNKGAERIFGYRAAEIIGRSVSVLIPPERADEELRILQRIGNGERIEHYQTVRRRKDGSHVAISLTVSPIRDAGGRIIGASKIARDISEQVRDRELLHRSEELFRVTLASIGDALICTDQRGRVTFMNAVAEELTGWTQQEAVGSPLVEPFRIIEERSRRPVEDPVTRVLREGTVAGLGNDTVLISRDGTERPIDDSAAPIRDAAGELIGAVLVFRDITERRARELATQRLASIVANSRDAIYSTSLPGNTTSHGTIQTWNRGAELLYGYSAAEIVGKPMALLIPEELSAQELDVLARLRAGENIEPYETRRLTKQGHAVEVSVSSSPLTDASGRIVGVSKIARDISARKRMEAALRESEALKTGMLNAGLDAMITINQATEVLEFNAAAERIFGYARRDAIGRPVGDLIVPPALREAHARGVARYLATGESRILGRRIEISAMRSDGSEFPCELALFRVLLEGPPLFTAALRDITERKQVEEALRASEEQFRTLALHDVLTDLPNRAYFVERLSQALARTRADPNYRIAVLLLDCDDFKTVNDSLGHAAGDRLLAEIAARLRKCVRPGDVVARLGGDEFTVLLEEVTGVPDVEHAARRIQDSLAAPLALEGREIVTTASIGAALSTPDYGQPHDLLRDADLAMYHAKQRGRARFQLFDVGLRESAQARFDMEADLRNALERREFGLLFQPTVELETGRVRGFEALLRWHRPAHGVITPVDFVALAEQIGLILPIGNWVLREACRQARTWQDALPLRISVNLSARQLAQPEFVEQVRTAIADAGIGPSSLVLEISERVLMEDVESSKAVLHRLRDVGVDVYMDNFGIAYSSLADLPRVPLQGIKVDRSLVHRMGLRRTDMEIVRSIVDLARNLGLAVIAEGVETVVQRERLIAFGCELGQGHLFARPLESRAAGALLVNNPGSDRRSA